jgi:hypothetical protein
VNAADRSVGETQMANHPSIRQASTTVWPPLTITPPRTIIINPPSVSLLVSDGLPSDIANITAADADIGKLVVSHLGQLPHHFAVMKPRSNLISDGLDRGHLPLLPVRILRPCNSTLDAA